MNIFETLWINHFKKLVVISFWLLGLCNNFAYVIMLSAANDILSSKNDTNSTVSTNTTNKYDCNDLSTGTILLADILTKALPKAQHYKLCKLMGMRSQSEITQGSIQSSLITRFRE